MSYMFWLLKRYVLLLENALDSQNKYFCFQNNLEFAADNTDRSFKNLPIGFLDNMEQILDTISACAKFKVESLLNFTSDN